MQRALVAVLHHNAKHRALLLLLRLRLLLHHIANKAINLDKARRTDVCHHMHQNLNDFTHTHIVGGKMIALDNHHGFAQFEFLFLDHGFIHGRYRTIRNELQMFEIAHMSFFKAWRLDECRVQLLQNSVAQSWPDHAHVEEKHRRVADIVPQSCAVNFELLEMSNRLGVKTALLQPLNQVRVLHVFKFTTVHLPHDKLFAAHR
mmetsp:Transcript_42373/g.69885  ORF Transcript_42373/g.69885 Transcript_42373/m.69885 type:complete len:203 (+) Transcript_42373:1112-1720(+)